MAGQESTCASLDLRLDTPPSDSDQRETTAPRKNKRKMSEPRRVSDFGVKRFCPAPDSRGSSPDPRYRGDCSSSVDGECAPDTPEAVTFVPDPEEDAEVERLNRPPSVVFPQGHLYQYPMPMPEVFHPYTAEMLRAHQMQHRTPSSLLDRTGASSANSLSQDVLSEDGDNCGRKRKNYKSMTIERRIEANARERSRVHTISAAFESLRRAVPSYSYNQKLSKLAILRIACCYILSLSRLAEKDYSRDQSRPSFGECVDLCTRTIQQEGRAKKRLH